MGVVLGGWEWVCVGGCIWVGTWVLGYGSVGGLLGGQVGFLGGWVFWGEWVGGWLCTWVCECVDTLVVWGLFFGAASVCVSGGSGG